MIKDFKSSINLDYKISPIIYNDLEDSNNQEENTKQNITIDDDIDSWKPMFNIRKEVADFIAMNSKSFNINHNNIFTFLIFALKIIPQTALKVNKNI